jgi:serine protease Do
MPELGFDDAFVQHTAPIDPGSSGGPLTNESGALVGVNVMLIRQRASMFFAVPSSAVIDTVRYAHALDAHKRSAQWMTTELDKACTALSSELAATTKSGARLTAFVSNAAVAERGLESFAQLARTPIGPQIRNDFFHDPMSAMRRSVLIRLGTRSSMAGGANGTCATLSPADATAIAEGKPVRRAVMTNSGHAMEVTWTFEHGAWRVANGEMVDVEEPPPPPPAKTTKVAKGKAAK